jgi:hypothetical protein
VVVLLMTKCGTRVATRQGQSEAAYTYGYISTLPISHIDLKPILSGELFGPLRDPLVFAQAKLDSEVHTIVWPSGADFDPATLHDWPAHERAFRAAAERWSQAIA